MGCEEVVPSPHIRPLYAVPDHHTRPLALCTLSAPFPTEPLPPPTIRKQDNGAYLCPACGNFINSAENMVTASPSALPTGTPLSLTPCLSWQLVGYPLVADGVTVWRQHNDRSI